MSTRVLTKARTLVRRELCLRIETMPFNWGAWSCPLMPRRPTQVRDLQGTRFNIRTLQRFFKDIDTDGSGSIMHQQ